MAYAHTSKKSGRTYYLHAKDVTLKNGREQRIYFFAPDERPGSLDSVPSGFVVNENPRTGLPFLKRG
jgi:hypothetical protein